MPRARQAAIAGAITRFLLAPEQPVLAGVRIQAGDGDARRAHAEPRQLARRQRDRRLERWLRQRARHVGQRDVNRRQHDAQRVGVEHHRDVRRAGQMREQIGVAAPRQAGQPERFLVDRRRRDRVDVAAAARRRPRARSRRTPRGRPRRSARPARSADAAGRP